MLKIRAIKIEINTSEGLFGADFKFSNGLNIIRGNNSTGKSSLFQAIIYGLGLEELLGGKNEKTMQSVLKDQVEFPKGSLHNITQSVVFLEIENKEIVTVKRTVTNETRKSQLVDVYFGALITNPKDVFESRQMYIHDAGGASDETFGFHLYLAEFLGWRLPEILTTKGDLHKLYIQQIAPAFIIEQKSGWSDFFATMPYFGMSNTQQRVIEFLLKLDVFDNEKRKQLINSSKQKLITNWQTTYNNFQNLASRSGGKLLGLESTPSIINNFDNINIVINSEDKQISLEEYNELRKKELFIIEEQPPITVGKKVNQNEEKLKTLNNYLNQISLNYDFLSSEIGFDLEKLRQYNNKLLLFKKTCERTEER